MLLLPSRGGSFLFMMQRNWRYITISWAYGLVIYVEVWLMYVDYLIADNVTDIHFTF